MNMFYFGNTHEYLTAEYAPSNRSACRTCKQKIDKQELRLGLCIDEDHFSGKYWYHLECFSLKPRHLILQEDAIQKIYNIDQLNEEDCKKVLDKIKEQIQRLKSGGKTKNAAKNATKKKPTIPEPQQQNQSQPIKREKKKQNSKSKKTQEKYSDSISQSSSSSQSQSSQYSKSEYSEQDFKVKGKSNKKVMRKSVPKKNIPKKKVAKKKVPIQKPYTAAEQKLFKQYYGQFSQLSINQLKQILTLNKQSKSGVKKQLAEKCADGKLKGQVPMCQKCGGGKLRFDRRTGIYSCPGYMEDTDFIRCGIKYPYSEIERKEWINN